MPVINHDDEPPLERYFGYNNMTIDFPPLGMHLGTIYFPPLEMYLATIL